MELESQMTKLPPYIKRWYEQTAIKLGQKTQPYTSLILIQYAIDNGAIELNRPSVIDVVNQKEKDKWQE